MRPWPPASAGIDAASRLAARSAAVSMSATMASSLEACTGVFAAVRAARLGARVAIVEHNTIFGGMAAAAMVNEWHSVFDVSNKNRVIAGLTHETIERLKQRDAVLETPPEQVEAPIQGSKRGCWVDVRQRALQQGGDVGKARLEPGLIMGRHRLRSCRLGLSRPFPNARRPCQFPNAQEFRLRRLVGAHQILRRLRVPRLFWICRHSRCGTVATRACRCPSSPRAAIRSDRPAIPCSMRLGASARCSGSPSRTWPTSRPN
jgi:hypothetical protein